MEGNIIPSSTIIVCLPFKQKKVEDVRLVTLQNHDNPVHKPIDITKVPARRFPQQRPYVDLCVAEASV